MAHNFLSPLAGIGALFRTSFNLMNGEDAEDISVEEHGTVDRSPNIMNEVTPDQMEDYQITTLHGAGVNTSNTVRVQQPVSGSTQHPPLPASPFVYVEQPTGCVERKYSLPSAAGAPRQLYNSTVPFLSSTPGSELLDHQSCSQPTLGSPVLRSATRKRNRPRSLSGIFSAESAHFSGIGQFKSSVWVCKICQKACASKAGLASHVRACEKKHGNTAHHKKANHPTKIQRGKPKLNPFVRKIPCVACSRIFSSKSLRDKHLKVCAPAPDLIVKVRKTLNNKLSKVKSVKRTCNPHKLVREIIDELVDNCPSLLKSYKKSQKLANADISNSLNSGMADAEIVYDEQDSTHPDMDTKIESESTECHIPPPQQTQTLPDPGIPTTINEQPMCNSLPYNQDDSEDKPVTDPSPDPIPSVPESVSEPQKSVTYKQKLKYFGTYLASKHLVSLDIRGDGHCIPNAVSSCLKYASPPFSFDSLIHSPGALLEGIVKEVSDNQSRYTAFVESDIDVLLQIRKYAYQKDYMNPTASMVPNILANMLKININIVTQYVDKETKEPLPNFDITPMGPGYATAVLDIYLLRTGTGEDAATHYQSLVNGKQLASPLQQMDHDNWLPGEQKWRCTLSGQKYLLFRSPSDLSNFAFVDNLVVMGQTYKSNEQNIQARRFPENHPVRNKIMATSKSLDQKRYGDSGEKDVYKDFLHLLQGLIRKFSDNKEMKDKLLGTKGFILCEATHSYLWGIGRDIRQDPIRFISNRAKWSDGIGLMSLGLMVVREGLMTNECSDAESIISNIAHIFTLPGVLGDSHDPSKDQVNSKVHSVGLDNTAPPTEASVHPPILAKVSLYSDNDSGDSHNHSKDQVNSKVDSVGLDNTVPPTEASVHPSPSANESLHSDNDSGSSNMVDSRNYQQRSQTPTQVLQLLTGQAYYHPPIGMNAYETVNTVTKARPDIGKFLLVKKGKITSVQPHILLALKQPLLPFHSILSGPLKRVCPVNTHRTLWLTKPLPNTNSDKWCSMVANNPKVVAISVSQKNPSHSIFTITTAYIASHAVPIEKEIPILELSNGNIVKLIPSGPTRCTKCQELGHLKRTCPSTTWTCVHCAEEHPSIDCRNMSNSKCARCKQKHKSSSLKCKTYIEAKQKANLPTLDLIPETDRVHPLSSHVTPGVDGQKHTEVQGYINNPSQHKKAQPLTRQSLYHPPRGMDACETVAVVSRFRPNIGKFLLVKKGKITALNPDAIMALKRPLLCLHPVLGIPLNPVHQTDNAHTLPVPTQNKSIPRLMDIVLPTHRSTQHPNMCEPTSMPVMRANPGVNPNNPKQSRHSHQTITSEMFRSPSNDFRQPWRKNTASQEDHFTHEFPPTYQKHSKIPNTQMVYSVKLTYAQLVTFRETFPQWTTLSTPIYNLGPNVVQ